MGLTDSLYDYVLQSGNPALQPDHLYQLARIWSRCWWRDQYPDHEVMDDNENYRGLEFIHVGLLLRHHIWRMAVGNPVTPGTSPDCLFQEMMGIRNVSRPVHFEGNWLTVQRDTLIYSSRPKWPEVSRPVAPSTPSTWALPISTPKFCSIAGYSASTKHRPPSIARPSGTYWKSPINNTAGTLDCCVDCTGHS